MELKTSIAFDCNLFLQQLSDLLGSIFNLDFHRNVEGKCVGVEIS
jgi:hypothetical protein